MENEILLLYNSEKQEDRKTKGYAGSLKDHALNERDILTDNLTETQIAELAHDMNIEIAGLIDKNSELFIQEYKNKTLSDDELTKVLVRNPEMIKTPIARVGDKVFFVGSAYDFVNKDLEIEGVKSFKGNKSEK